MGIGMSMGVMGCGWRYMDGVRGMKAGATTFLQSLHATCHNEGHRPNLLKSCHEPGKMARK